MLRNNTIDNCSLIELPKIKNRAGNITAIENNINIPFGVSRVFIYMTFQEVKTEGHMLIRNVINS